MNLSPKSLLRMGALIAVAAAGVFQLIDQTSMIVLAIALVLTGPMSAGCRLPGRNA